MLTFCVFTVGMFTVGAFTVGLFTVGLVLFVLKGGAPLPRRGHDVCPLLVSYFSTVFRMYCWHMFSRFWLPFGFHARTVFDYFGITFSSIVFALIFIDFGKDLVSCLMCFLIPFSIRARNLLNLPKHLFSVRGLQNNEFELFHHSDKT